MNTLQRTALASAIALALGTTATLPVTAEAAIIDASFTGLFTLINDVYRPVTNTSYPYSYDPTWGHGLRTPISGTFSFDTSTGAGSATVNGFNFLSGWSILVHDFSLQAIGDGAGGTGTLVAGGLLADWAGNNNISVGIILDAAGFFGAGPVGTSDVISGAGAIPASNNSADLASYPLGPAPLAMTTWNTGFNHDASCVLSATCLAGNDTIGGSPLDNGPFPNYSPNFDFTSIHITSVTAPPVPLPAAAWLFGSGLLGLLGIAGRKRGG